MYMQKMISVGKVENGYLVEVCVPLKKDTKKTSKMQDTCCAGSCDKQYIAEDAKDVAELIQDLMPLLDADYTSEDDFDKAFAAATKAVSADETKEGEE